MRNMKPRSRGGPIDIAIGQNIRRYRMAKGMSQSVLGKAVNVTFQQIQKYERGENAIPSTRLATLATALEIPLHVLLNGSDETHVPLASLSTNDIKTVLKLEKLRTGSRKAVNMLIDALLIAEGNKPTNGEQLG